MPWRPVLPLTRFALLLASFLVFLAGVQLFLLTTHMERWFAWTIGVPLTGSYAVLGILHLVSVARFASDLRGGVRSWLFVGYLVTGLVVGVYGWILPGANHGMDLLSYDQGPTVRALVFAFLAEHPPD